MLITWNADPTIFSLGFLSIRWYGLLFASSFILAYYLLRWMFVRDKQPVELVERLLLFMIVGVILGARLGHTLFYQPDYYLSNPIEIIKIWRGGLASHGAAIGILLGAYFYVRKIPGQSFLWILDRIAITVALAGFCIRLGNFFNSEIIGGPTNDNWGVIFQRIDLIPRHPAQLYESIAYLILFVILFTLYTKTNLKSRRGFITGIYFIGIFVPRFLIEFVKEDQVAFEAGMVLNMGQLLSIPAILFGIILLFVKLKPLPEPAPEPLPEKKHKKSSPAKKKRKRS